MDDLVAKARPIDLADTPNVLIGPESWQRLWPDCQPLMLAHRAELGQDDSRAPFDPDHDLIQSVAQGGGLLLLGARLGPQLVGYSIWYLVPSFETKGLKMAMQAPWYVMPEYRSAGIGIRLWNLAVLQLRQRRVKMLRCHYPAEGPGSELGRFFARKGAKTIGTEVEIWLEDLS